MVRRVNSTVGFFVCFSLVALLGCVKNSFPEEVPTKQDMPAMTIPFVSEDFEPYTFDTRSSLSDKAERRVVNGEVLIFNADGELAHSYFLDRHTIVSSIEGLATLREGWFVSSNNEVPSVVKVSSGNITNGHVYIVANLFNDTFNVSRQMIQTVNYEDDLKELICRFAEEPSTARLSGMIYVGYTSATIDGNSITLNPSGNDPGTLVDGKIVCKRVDAKVKVNVGIVPGAVSAVQELDKNGVPITVYRKVVGFTPSTYQVMNLPKGSYLVEREDEDATDDLTGGYFNGKELPFEEREQNVPYGGYAANDITNSNYLSSGFTRNIDSFSFYMLENRKSAKQSVNSAEAQSKYGSVGKYHLRDKRNKDATGEFDATDGMWEFAPETATYVIIKGTLNVEVTTSNSSEHKDMSANVTYYVHLGNFGSSTEEGTFDFDNYSIKRHTFYTYNINIKGFNKIEVEVDLDNTAGYNPQNEKHSGAEGVVLYYNQYYEFDSHYSQRVFSLNIADLEAIGADKITWAVSTPFGRAGVPDKVGIHGEEVANGLDYQWVHFLVNTKNASYVEPHGGIGNTSRVVTNPQYPLGCRLNRMWPEGGKNNSELMDVMELCQYLRDEMGKYERNEESAFDSEGNIYLTTFIDEFYYTENPVTLEKDPNLWHRFVNKSPRLMVIVCDNRHSIDGNSKIYDGAIVISQHSIQTIYNDESATDAWGSETAEEYKDRFFFFSRSETRSYTPDQEPYSGGATSEYNGLYNSGRLWGLTSSGNTYNTLYWSDFFDYCRENDYTKDGVKLGFLRDDDSIANLRFGALSRNRDNNGNGIIDPEEITWYMASLGQLQDIFIGGLGISKAAQLYNIENPSNATSGYSGNNFYLWRSHVVSSTFRGSAVKYVWAEEGCSISDYGKEWSKYGAYSVRCVRNLPSNSERVYDINNIDDYPSSPIVVTKIAADQYEVDLTMMNKESKRPRTTTELAPMNENSITARPSDKFVTAEYKRLNADDIAALTGRPASDFSGSGGQDKVYDQLYSDLMIGKSWSESDSRAPNLREMVILALKIPYNSDYAFWHNSAQSYHIVVNTYSFGNPEYGGKNYDTAGNAKKSSWFVSPQNITIETQALNNSFGIRFVKDI